MPRLSASEPDPDHVLDAHPHPHTNTGPSTGSPSLIELMRMTRQEWTRGSAIRRTGYPRLKRNVVVAIGNWIAGLDEPPQAAVAVLRDALDDEEPLVREHVAWALDQVESDSVPT